MLRAAAGYTIVFTLIALPWIRIAARGVPAGAVMASYHDTRLIAWVLAWGAHALATDPADLFDANIFYPAPAQVTGSDYFLSSQLLFAPVFWATGNAVLSASVAAMISYPLAALAMERLLVGLGCGAGVAWLGGLLFALGPFQVPGNVGIFRYLIVYLPLAALAITGLRQRPTAWRAALLGVVCTLGFLSGYYMAVMLAVTAALWVLMEWLRPGPGRPRFLILAAAAGTVSFLVLLALSLPYLRRADAVQQTFLEETCRSALANRLAAFAFLAESGALAIVLALGGLVALVASARGTAPVARRGAVLLLVALVFMLGPVQCVGDVKIPMPFALILATPGGFFRYPWRFTVVAGFGIALLAAAALEALRRRGGRVLLLAAAGTLLVTRGGTFGGSGAEEIRGQSLPIYGMLAEATRDHAGGSLLELPLADVREKATAPDSMVGSTRHWLPLVAGYTGYDPPHYRLVAHLISALPAKQALDDLVDMTGLRWLLLRPAEAWRLPNQRERLLKLPGVVQVLEHDGWVLARVDRVPEHPDWFAAVAEGPREGYTLLGAPLLLLPDWSAVSQVQVTKASIAYAGGQVGLVVRIRNAGQAPWPVSVPPGAAERRTVQLVSWWTPVEGVADAAPSLETTSLPRDVAPGETMVLPVYLRTPAVAGLYDLDLAIRQAEGNRFDNVRNAPTRIRFRVNPAEEVPPEKRPPAPSESGDDATHGVGAFGDGTS